MITAGNNAQVSFVVPEQKTQSVINHQNDNKHLAKSKLLNKSKHSSAHTH